MLGCGSARASPDPPSPRIGVFVYRAAFLLEAASGKYVMRKKPPGKLISKTAHAVEREYAVMTALARTDVPVPRTFCLCDDSAVIGTPFFVMEYVSGRIFTDPAMPGLSSEHRAACYASVVRTLSAIHSVDVDAVGLGSFGRRGGYYERQLKTLKKVSAAQVKAARAALQRRRADEESGSRGAGAGGAGVKVEEGDEDRILIPRFDDMAGWLGKHLPPDAVTLCHGDFKVDNMVFHATEPRVIAVLDWELSTIGHPMADVANLVAAYYTPRDVPGLPLPGLMGLDLAGQGIPDEQSLVRTYCESVGRPYPDPSYEFYVAFFYFKYTVIMQGIMARMLKGVASSATANRYAAGMMMDFLVDGATSRMQGINDGARSKL